MVNKTDYFIGKLYFAFKTPLSHSKITYRSTLDEKQRSQGAINLKIVCNKNVSFGPSDKRYGNSLTSSKRGKTDQNECGKKYFMLIEFGTEEGCFPGTGKCYY